MNHILLGKLHVLFASTLFLTFAFFALVLFRKTDPRKPPTPEKLKRNFVYLFCGIGILICIALIVVLRFVPPYSAVYNFSPLFWLESVAIVFFGISWLVKGEAILKDEIGSN
jgi:hypothetical protein